MSACIYRLKVRIDLILPYFTWSGVFAIWGWVFIILKNYNFVIY